MREVKIKDFDKWSKQNEDGLLSAKVDQLED